MPGLRRSPKRRAQHDHVAAVVAAVVLCGCVSGSEQATERPAVSSTSTPTGVEPPNDDQREGDTAPTSDDEADRDDGRDAGRVSELAFGEPTTVRLSPEGEAWIDPEVLLVGEGEPLLAWQEPGGAVRVADLDAESGGLVDGSSRVVATDGANLRSTFNGPEFGLDSDGWSVTYTSAGIDGNEIAVARPTPDAPGFDVETIAANAPRFSPLASQVPDGSTTRLIALAEGASTGWGDAVYLDLAEPATTHDVMSLDRRTDGDLRWVSGTYVLATNNHPAHPGALALVDTETHESEAVSAPGTNPTFPYGWVAPDAPSGMAVLGVVDDTQMVVWAEGDDGWERWHTLTSPAPDYSYFGSPEPFVVADRSFVSFAVAPTPEQIVGETDQQVWLTSLDGETSVRCDDGRDAPTMRVDPEVLVVDGRVYVYYYILEEGGSAVHVCAIDLVPAGSDAPVRDDSTAADAPERGTEVQLRPVSAESTGPTLETINGDHLTYAPSSEPRGRLLLFFPGTGAAPDRYELFLEHAGSLGFHVVGVGYDNLESVNFQLCAGQPAEGGCHEAVRREILFGEPSGYSPPDVTEADSAVARVRALLEHLATDDPSAGWRTFLDPEGVGGIAWSDITVAGHSQGGGHAAYLATEFTVERAVLFGATEPQPWTADGSATSPERYFGLAHGDERSARAIATSWENLAIPGEVTFIEDARDGFDGSHRLYTRSQDCSGDPDDRGYHHNCYIVDDYLPEPVAGRPYFAEVWTYTLVDPI